MDAPLTFNLEPGEQSLFLEDVDERLNSLERGIIRLEHGSEEADLQEIFRAAHTLKALGGAVDHRRMVMVAHVLETLLDALRERRLAPTRAVADALLAATDVLRTLRDEVATGKASQANVEGTVALLRSLSEQLDVSLGNPAPLTETQQRKLRALVAAGYTPLTVTLRVAPAEADTAGSLHKGLALLRPAGQLIAQQPEPETAERELWLLLATRESDEQIAQRLAPLSDTLVAQCAPFESETLDAPPPPAAPRPERLRERGGDKTVRISVERLDALMDLVGELVTDRTRLQQFEGTLRTDYGKEGPVRGFSELAAHVGRVVDQLQVEVMRARMLPISHLFDKFPRLVRDAARSANKRVDLQIEGEATELDRSIIEGIGDPLLHLLRNAVDHGIEGAEERVALGKPATGTILLRAAPIEGQIRLTVQDDGRGIDVAQVRESVIERGLLSEEKVALLSDEEVVNLIFLPTLSTARHLTALSGRGVGMDVVRTAIERLGGSIVIESEPGIGTTFHLTLPLTLAIIRTMLVAVGQAVYAIPLTTMSSSLYLSEAEIETVQNKPTLHWRGQTLPLLDLRDLFALPTLRSAIAAKPAIVTVTWGRLQVGLIVDRIIGQQETVVKPLSPVIGRVPGVSGGAILGDGSIALILDIPSLLEVTLQARRQGALP